MARRTTTLWRGKDRFVPLLGCGNHEGTRNRPWARTRGELSGSQKDPFEIGKPEQPGIGLSGCRGQTGQAREPRRSEPSPEQALGGRSLSHLVVRTLEDGVSTLAYRGATEPRQSEPSPERATGERSPLLLLFCVVVHMQEEMAILRRSRRPTLCP